MRHILFGFAALVCACAGDEFEEAGTGGGGGTATGGTAAGGAGGTSGGGTGAGGAGGTSGGGTSGGGTGGAPAGGTGGAPAGGTGGAPAGGGSGGTVGTGGTGGATICPNVATTGLIFYDSFDDAAKAVAPSPGVTTNAGLYTVPVNDFVDGKCNKGFRVNGSGDYAEFTAPGNIKLDRGTIDFWYKPAANHNDAILHRFVSVGSAVSGAPSMSVFHASNNAFEVHVYQGALDAGATLSRICQVDGTKYSWTADQWVRVTITWDFTGSGPAFHVYFNANEVGGYITNGSAPFAIGAIPGTGQKLYFGAEGKTDSKHANGVLDELRIYDQPIVP